MTSVGTLFARFSDLLLTSRSLAPLNEAHETLGPALRETIRGATGGLVEEIVHDGDPRERARLVSTFASPGAPRSRPTILFVHGKGGGAGEWRRDAARALRRGYNVLVPNLRGHPPSEGARITFGLLEANDLALLLREATARFGIDPERLGVDACSLGTLTALRLAASYPVAALWLQSPFGDLPTMAVRYVHRATQVPERLLQLPVRAALTLLPLRTGIALSAIDPVAAARRVTAPAMVIQGMDDEMVPPELPRAIYEALAGEKDLWRVPRCGHCHHADEPQALHSAEYVKRWTAFFAKHLPAPRRHAARARR